MIFPALTGRCFGKPRRFLCLLVNGFSSSSGSGGGGVGSGDEEGTEDKEEEEAEEAADRKGVELECEGDTSSSLPPSSSSEELSVSTTSGSWEEL